MPEHQSKAGWRNVGIECIYFRSGWEANYGRYLEWLRERGEIAKWEHEPETFWFTGIKRGVCSYLPDFRVTENNGDVIYHEVKGWMDPRSKTKLKRMAKYWPNVKIVLIDRAAVSVDRKYRGPDDTGVGVKAMPERIQRKRTKGWKMPPNTVYVGRGSRWGNPFKVGMSSGVFLGNSGRCGRSEILVPELTLVQCIEFYRNAVEGYLSPEMYPHGHDFSNRYRPHGSLHVLRGKNLACWCKVGHPCHGDVLLDLANRGDR